MIIKIYSSTNEEYKQELSLRDRILRKPLGMNLFDEDLSQDKSDIHIGAFRENRLVGVILLSPINKNIIKMRQVAVDDEYQGRGIGSAMVRFSEEYALDNGFKIMTMHARRNAMEFYAKLGYETVGEEFIEVSLPHFKMIKYLK